MALFVGGERNATHAMLPVFIPLLLPLTIIAIPMADLLLAIVRRTWNGQSPFAADRGHLHHRLLELGHSHSRAVLIMYFWSGLIAFGTVAYSVNSASMWIVLAIAALSALGLVLLLLPRFTPRAPRWAEGLVPPRYRHTRRAAEAAAEAAVRDDTGTEPQPARPVAAGVSGVNGATAVGPRSRFPDRRKAGSAR
jgi:UDP-GlcNAc:undecaprenyl-phosphate GlcNAc-1-phosphate transferase